MLKGVYIHETRVYVSKSDNDKDNPTKFHIGALDPFLKAHIDDSSAEFVPNSDKPEEDASLKLNIALRNLLTVKFGVRKVENFWDPATKAPITVEAREMKIGGKNYQALPDEVLEVLPTGESLISELAEEIRKDNSLSEAETKN